MQLLYYLFLLEEKGFKVEGEIRVPSEKKVIKVFLNKKNKKRILALTEKINSLIKQKLPPYPSRNKYCKNCSFKEFCWS